MHAVALPAKPAVEKGHFRGECNRTACTNANATWFNDSTRMYYCESCAQKINEFARVEGETIVFEMIEVEICRGCGNDYPCTCGCTDHPMTARRPKHRVIQLKRQ